MSNGTPEHRENRTYDVHKFQEGCDGVRNAAHILKEILPEKDSHIAELVACLTRTTLNICAVISSMPIGDGQKAALYNALSTSVRGTVQAATEIHLPNPNPKRPGSPNDYAKDARELWNLPDLF